jgi:hypothetical protein
VADRFQTVRETDLGAGIDAQSAENNIPPGYSENLLNVDASPTGQLITRKGYEGYLGYVPVRVLRAEYTDALTKNLCFYLDGSIELASVDLTNSKKSPLLISGKTSKANTGNVGDFPHIPETHWYETFTTDILKTFLAGSNTLLFPQSEHSLSSPYIFLSTLEATSVLDSSNSLFYPEEVRIDKATADIEIDYNNGLPSFTGYLLASNKQASAGNSYISTPSTIPPGTSAITISAATHGLSNFNILTQCWIDTVSTLTTIQPDSVEIDTAGQVTISITNSSVASIDVVVGLASVPISSVAVGSVAAESSVTVTVPNLTTDFIRVACYLEQTLGGTVEQVIPDSVTVDAATSTASITFTNNNSTSANFKVYYEQVTIATNKLCVNASVIGAPDVFTDEAPQITIYGLPHSTLYGSDPKDSAGWVNHIDAYRSVNEDRLIAGLGGNLYSAQLRSDNLDSAAYMPLYYPALRARVSVDIVVGPAFVDTSDTSSRTRGYIQADTAGDSELEIESATWDNTNKWVVYRLLAPSLVINGTLTTIISNTVGLEDVLQVSQMGNSRLVGSFKIKNVVAGADYLDISVENPKITSSDYNEVDAGGLGGIYSDRLTTVTSSPFIQNDTISSELFEGYNVLAATGTTLALSNVGQEVSIPAGLRLVASRTGRVVPLRTATEIASVENLVPGDMLIYNQLPNRPRVTLVRPQADQTVAITTDGTTATLTLASGETSVFGIGDYILLRNSLIYGGEHVITAIPSLTTLQFATTQTVGGSAILSGNCIVLDETLTIADTVNSTNSLQVQGRWIPIEAPEASGDLLPTTHVRYLDSLGYTNQPILRSTMVQDNMYFVNGQDEVLKFDGQNIYRAGLPRWQTNLYATTDTTATGKIVLGNPSISYSANASNRFTTPIANQLVFRVGNKIQDDADGTIYTVTDISTHNNDAYIVVNKTIDHATASGNLIKVVTFNYYARLNAVDANNNLIASAVVGADDTVMELGADAAVRLRAVGFPALDLYDYNRLELQWYRTKADSPAPFYLLTTLPLTFNSNDGYVDYIDTSTDSDLRELDPISTALEGAELGTGWTEPVRASYITSADNRLVLGNLRDYPTIDIQLTENSNGPIEIADLTATANRRWLIRNDNTDVGTSTDMINRVALQFVSSATTIAPATDLTNPATNVLQVASVAHGLAVGNWVYLFHSAVQDGNRLDFAGHYQVAAVPDVDSFRLNVAGARAGLSTDVDRFAKAVTAGDVPVYLGTDGNYAMLNGNRDVSIIPNYQFLAMRRAANALNSAMRKVDTTIAGYESFSPWILASAGNEFTSGQLILRQPIAKPTLPEVQIPALDGSFDVFVNQVKRSGGNSAGALERLYPSRLIQSFNNFPEIFDRPTVEVDIDSKSAVDVNTADGQAITSLIPFFGESAFGAALKGSTVVVFKENSIYLQNTVLKGQGANSIQKIESQGKGCTAPFSVAPTRNGIVFANESGIYRLAQNLTVDYVGRKYERVWKETVNKDKLQLATGHNFAQGNQYKLSFPAGAGQKTNNQVAVYYHTREYESQQMGSWSTYDNHSATGWANLLTTAYFATTDGQVMSIRNTGTVSDYRDDAGSFNWQMLLRAMDFGNAGERKIFGWVISYFRTLVDTRSASLSTAIDMAESYLPTDPFRISNVVPSNNLSDQISRKVDAIRTSLKARIGEYLQLNYTGTCYDAPVELTGVDYLVAPKSYRGITEAAKTSK